MTDQHVQQAHPVRSDYHLIGWLKTEDRDALFRLSLARLLLTQIEPSPHNVDVHDFFFVNLFVGNEQHKM